jgi:hypothetical protein
MYHEQLARLSLFVRTNRNRKIEGMQRNLATFFERPTLSVYSRTDCIRARWGGKCVVAALIKRRGRPVTKTPT